ncbi:major facilitator superfamily domain-containing protein [Xylariaceae sp. FL1272]|nr:major facilitator superfamily domain-containing protein [Xylariaceae sp. FL1272]
MAEEMNPRAPGRSWRNPFIRRSDDPLDQGGLGEKQAKPVWNMGMLNDKETIEVPGSVLLLSKERNEPLGLRHAPARTSHSSLPTGYLPDPPMPKEDEKKKTSDGEIILEPQPDDSHNDPLNWPAWRRDCALLSLGLYCMVGGGTTPIIAAGFTNVAEDYGINVSEVSYTTGLYMLGLGIGCVLFSPTAILYGKRPVYLFSSILYIISAVWCALSPNFPSLILARIFQGIAVSPVECLPSATIAEIFFLHERAFRIGIYTLLLLGGKNLVPLVSAVIIQSLSWRWTFWILAIVVAFCGILLFFFVPETFWDRNPIPRPRKVAKRPSFFSRRSTERNFVPLKSKSVDETKAKPELPAESSEATKTSEQQHDEEKLPADKVHKTPGLHVGFAPNVEDHPTEEEKRKQGESAGDSIEIATGPATPGQTSAAPSILKADGVKKPDSLHVPSRPQSHRARSSYSIMSPKSAPDQGSTVRPTPDMHNFNSPFYQGLPREDYFKDQEAQGTSHGALSSDTDSERMSFSNLAAIASRSQIYTHKLREAPRQSFKSLLRVHNGRINHDKWWKACVRPFILFAYPAVLWSSAVYACSVGWLIVISESVAVIYRNGDYHFGALSTGLVYISPFIGGVLGTAVAGKVSDVIVKAMARRNGGLYEPEFRLVMAIPILITTVIGLIGFGWSAGVDDPWIVPTVFFGVVSFGCSLGSTTAITFVVDSYRQYAGEALVTLNFSKNVFHGFVFSWFVTGWLESDGPKSVYMWIGIIQLIVLLFTLPMYIYGKRARMWTVRMNFMEKF